MKKDKHMTKIGGQAVMEGVMMRGPKSTCIAIRKADGEIATTIDRKGALNKKHPILKFPFIRGVVNFIDSMVIGTKALMVSADYIEMEEDEQTPSKFEQFLQDKLGDKLKDVVVYFAIAISLVFSIGLFILLPTFLAGLTGQLNIGAGTKTFLEGLLRIVLFVSYLALVSNMKDIKRVFQYHGAEHKTIFAYEDGAELTVENVRKYPRLHPRCGTNFLLVVMIISIIIFSFLKWDSLLYRIGSRLLLLPVVAGVSYEIIRFVGRSQGLFARAISYPGMMLQKLTTREPDDSQLEVAIAALSNVITDNREDDKW